MVNRIITELMKYKEIHEQRVKDPFIIVPAMQAMNLTVQGIVQVVQRYMERTGGVDLLIVDYAQRLRLAPEESQMQRYLQIKGIAEGFRDFSSNYKVPTVLLAQLKRGENVFHEGKRKVQRPRLEDLKESGALEENASSVLLTHYPYKYEYQEVFADDAAEVASREGFADRTYLELYVEKNRFGASTMLPLKVDDKFGIITQGQPRGF
jgi:replicative DNA helicase